MIYVLIACLLLSHETAAYYAEGLVRFFPLDGNYNDMTGSGYDLGVMYNHVTKYDDDNYYQYILWQDDTILDKFTLEYGYEFPNPNFDDEGQEGAIGFEESSPYPDGQFRPVLKLGYGPDFLQGSAEGLPEGNAPRTIMGWLKKTKDTVVSAPFFYGSTECNQAYYVLLPNSNKDQVHLNHLCKDYDEGINSAAKTIFDDKWYHVAFTYDGEKNSAYLDGKFIASGTPSVKPDTDTSPENAFTAVGPYGKFEGYLADFAIFNRALSPEEVKAIYDSPNGIDVTASPIASPTASPIVSPTLSPITSPTASPITSPTASPITNPTDSPTGVTSPSSCSCCEEMRSEMNTILSEILDLVKTPPEPECIDQKGYFKFGPDQKRIDWCAFIRRGKNDAQKKKRCNRPDDDDDTGLHTFCCEACKDVL